MEDKKVLSSTSRDIIWTYHASSELRKEVWSCRFENYQCCTWCELMWKKKKIGSRILLKEHLDIVKSWQGFPGSSAGKEFACNAEDSVWILGLRRSPGEGIGCPLQYFWASLMAQMVQNEPAIWETWLPSLSWEDPLEKWTATHSSIMARRIPRGVTKRWTWLINFHFNFEE